MLVATTLALDSVLQFGSFLMHSDMYHMVAQVRPRAAPLTEAYRLYEVDAHREGAALPINSMTP